MTVLRNTFEHTGDTTGGATQLTASFTPSGAALQLLAVMDTHATAAPTVTVTGCGLTWAQVDTVLFGASLNRLSLFRAMGDVPTTGQLTITGNAGVTGYTWGWSEFVNVDNLSSVAATKQSANNSAAASGAALVVTLAAFSNTDNATFGAFAKDTSGAATWTVGSGFLAKSEAGYATPNARIATEWNNVPDTTVDMTPTVASNMAGIAVEIGVERAHPPLIAPHTAP